MEKVFEAYVAKKMRKAIANETSNGYWSGWNVYSQYGAKYLFEKPTKFRMRPDIVLKNKDGNIIILDTKWKRLVNNYSVNYNIAQQDMYQMFAYGHKYDCQNIWLIYPRIEEMDGIIQQFISEYKYKSDDNNMYVTAYCLDLKITSEKGPSPLLTLLKEMMSPFSKIE